MRAMSGEKRDGEVSNEADSDHPRLRSIEKALVLRVGVRGSG